jgi:phospholipase/carboxylesterase
MDRQAEGSQKLREVGQPRGAAQFGGVLLHGRGRSPEEMVDLATRMANLDRIRWLVPVAEAGSWYPRRFTEPVALNEPFLSQAVQTCHSRIVEVSEDGRLKPERMAVVGFSQGACLAIEYVLRHPGCCENLIAFTGGFMDQRGPNAQILPTSLAGLRVLITGSDVDEWVPERSTRETARILRELGAEVTLRIYAGRPHVVHEDELTEARTLLEARL